MFEKATSAIRHTTGNRFTPCVSLLLSAASFVLTLLVILPATKGGNLENLHLITVNFAPRAYFESFLTALS